MNIVLVGHVCIDKNVSEKVSYTSWGSALMYMARYYASQDKETVSLIAPYGEDFLPHVRSTNMLNRPHGGPTLVYKNVSRHGKRTQECENTGYAAPVLLNDNLKKHIAAADIMIVAPLLPNYPTAYVTKLLSNKKSSCLSVLLPQGYLRSVLSNGHVSSRDFYEASGLLPGFDIMIISEDDVPDALSVSQQWARQNPATKIIVTQGDKGASWVRQDSVISVRTQPVPERELVDTVGCGDVFSAACVHNYVSSKDVQTAMAVGNTAARERLHTAKSLGN